MFWIVQQIIFYIYAPSLSFSTEIIYDWNIFRFPKTGCSLVRSKYLVKNQLTMTSSYVLLTLIFNFDNHWNLHLLKTKCAPNCKKRKYVSLPALLLSSYKMHSDNFLKIICFYGLCTKCYYELFYWNDTLSSAFMTDFVNMSAHEHKPSRLFIEWWSPLPWWLYILLNCIFEWLYLQSCQYFFLQKKFK